ncbi:MAG: TraR/DksA C4-type zinc finger protein [Acidobacteriota bacterium]
MTDTAKRDAELKQMLIDRRREMHGDVQRRIRHGRTDRSQDVCDDVEHSDAGIQGNIDFALLQMRAETLARIEEALVRLEAGKYGFCFECESHISERRLRALPFAVRCQACEGRREKEQGRLTQRRETVSLFPEVASS